MPTVQFCDKEDATEISTSSPKIDFPGEGETHSHSLILFNIIISIILFYTPRFTKVSLPFTSSAILILSYVLQNFPSHAPCFYKFYNISMNMYVGNYERPFPSRVPLCNTVTIFISCSFVDYLNKTLSVITFFKVLTFPFLLCMTGFQMVQVTLYLIYHKIIRLVLDIFLYIRYRDHNQDVTEYRCYTECPRKKGQYSGRS
jgi:hypothetical protein